MIYGISYAQMCPCDFGKKDGEAFKRHEIGVNAFNVQEETINFYAPNSLYKTNYVNGLNYKYHFNQFSLRSSISILNNKFSLAMRDTMNYNEMSAKSQFTEARLGLEKTFLNKRFQFFAGADVLFGLGSYSGHTKGSGDFQPYYDKDFDFKMNYFGVSPVVGIKFHINRTLSITAESGISIIRYNTHHSNIYDNESDLTIIQNSLRCLSLNCHF